MSKLAEVGKRGRGRRPVAATVRGSVAGLALAAGLAGVAGAASGTTGSTGVGAAATTTISNGATTATTTSNDAGTTATASGSTTQWTGPQARQHLEQALARREATLAKLTASVSSSRTLSSSVRSTLESQLSSETSGIDALAAAVPSEPATQLAQTASTMVHQYRVYLVMAPKVHIAERAAAQAAIETRASKKEPRVTQLITSAAGKGRTVQAARQAYQSLVTLVAQATADTQAATVPAVLAVAPSAFPGDAAPLSTARSELRSARSVLPSARADLRTIRSTLRRPPA